MGNCFSDDSYNSDYDIMKQMNRDTGWSFNVKVPGGRINPRIILAVVSMVLSGIFIFFTLKKIDLISTISFVILALLIYMLLASMGGNIMSVSLPFTSHPTPPRLGLDGVSMDNYIAGKQLE